MSESVKLYDILIFDGKAKEAMDLYAQAFSGKCDFDYFTNVPEEATGGPLNEADKQRVMHSTMTVGNPATPFLMASDTFPGSPEKYVPGNNHSVSVHSTDIELLEKVFNLLSESGTIKMPFAETFWATRFGMLTDKFGVDWMFNADKDPSPDASSKAIRVNSYLVFDGNAREAMTYYGDAFQGKCVFSSFGEAPDDSTGGQLSEADKQRVMHCCMTVGNGPTPFLMGSDTFPGSPEQLVFGNNYAVTLNTDASEADIVRLEKLFSILSDGGVVKMPLGETFWAVRFGMCTDKFGVHWMFNAINHPTADTTGSTAECATKN